MRAFLAENADLIQDTIDESVRMAKTSVKTYLTLNAALIRESEDGTQSTDTTFQSGVHFDTDFDVDQAAAEMVDQLDHFNKEGSSWVFEAVLSAKITTAVYRPLAG